MKAVCIIGSPRSNGSTAYLLDNVIKGMEETGIQTRRYCLGDLNINFCCGCKMCYKTGACIQDDDVQKIIEDIRDANIIVIASPSYWGDITGQLKVFFDRNTPYGDTNDNRVRMPINKTGIAIAVRAGTTDGENTHILESIEHYYGHLGIKTAGKLSVTKVETLEDLLKNHKEEIKQAYEIGKTVSTFVEQQIVDCSDIPLDDFIKEVIPKEKIIEFPKKLEN